MKLFILLPFILTSYANVNSVPLKAPDDSLNTQNTIYYDLTDDEVKNYYSDLNEGDKGETLLSKLQNILKKGQVKLNYSSGNTKSTSWDGYYLFERNFDLSPLEESELSGNYKKSGIWLNVLYSSSPIYIENKINSGDYKYYDENGELVTSTFKNSKAQFDREHVFPKSFGFNGSGDAYEDFTAGCDIHNLHAGEHNGNSSGHNNYPYGNVSNKKASSTKAITSGLTNEIVGYLGDNDDGIKVFEPLDKDKGDIARSIFYMAARYHTYEKISDKDRSPSLTLADNVESGSTIEPEDTIGNPCAYGELSDLLQWNIEDPVSKYELHRNNLVYNAFQGNRNPFIDCPSWAEACFNSENSNGITFDNILTPGKETSSNPDTDSPGTQNHTYTLYISKDDSFKSTYFQFESFDPTGIDITLLKDGVELTGLSYELYMGNQLMTSKYMFIGLGTKEIIAKVKIDGQEIISTNSITITLELSIQQIIILAVVIIVILILAIIFIALGKKRKKRKKKFIPFQNKTSKTKK